MAGVEKRACYAAEQIRRDAVQIRRDNVTRNASWGLIDMP